MDGSIDNLVISVTANADAAARMFDRLASSAGSMKNASKGATKGMHEMADSAKDLDNATRSAGTESGKAQKQVRGLGDDAKKAGDKAKHGASGLDKFWQSLRRIAFYRAVRSVIRSITDAFKTGMTNMYQWSKVMDGTFAKSMDRIATSTLYLKNSLGAMLAPIINALAPILDTIVDFIVKIINGINMVFAMLSGSQTYTVAKKVATTWGDAGKDAVGSAKKASDEIKRTILGFDEINKLEKQNAANGGIGGSGKNGNDFADMFETKQLPPWMATIASAIDKFKANWLALVPIVLAGWAAIKKAVQSVVDLTGKWLKNLAGKTISIAVSLVRAGWDTITGWALKFGAAVVDLAVKIKTSAAQLWASFKYAWLRETPVLQVGITLLTTAAILWERFSKSWLKEIPVLQVGITLLENAMQKLWIDVQKGWATIQDKVLSVAIKPEVAPSTKPTRSWNGAGATGDLPGDVEPLTWSKLSDMLGLTSNANAFKGVGSWQGAGVTGDLPGDVNPFTVSQLFGKLGGLNKQGIGKTLTTVLVGIAGAALAGSVPGLAASANNAMFIAPQNKLKEQLKKYDPRTFGGGKSAPKSTGTARNSGSAVSLPSPANLAMLGYFVGNVDKTNTKVNKSFKDMVKSTGESVNKFVNNVKDGINNARGITFEPVGGNIVNTMDKGIRANSGKPTKSLDVIINEGFRIASGKSYEPAGQGIVNSMNTGIVNNSGKPTKSLDVLVNEGFRIASGKSFEPAGKNMVSGLNNGVNNNKSTALNTITTLMSGMFNAADGFSFKPIGKKASEDVGNGTKDNTWRATGSMWDMLQEMFNTKDSFSYESIGRNAADDISTGIDDNTWRTDNSMWDLLDDMYEVPDDFMNTYNFSDIGKRLCDAIYNGIKNNVSKVTNAINGISNALSKLFNGSTSTPTTKKQTASKPTRSSRMAFGGIFANGAWTSIPQYANGTLNAGSLFWAGEAGPEIVGHIGGRTEVLNKSQIASAMYSAVSAAMAPAAANFAQAANYLQAESAPFDMTMLAEMVRQGVETAMERERDIQRQQLDMLRQINDKEFSADISTSSINSAQRRMNRRAGTTIVPLTT